MMAQGFIFGALGGAFGILMSYPLCVLLPAALTGTDHRAWFDWWMRDPTGGFVVFLAQLVCVLAGAAIGVLLVL